MGSLIWRGRARSAVARACPRSRPDTHPNFAPDHGTSEAASRTRCRPGAPRPSPRAERRSARRPSACTRDCPRTTRARRFAHRVARDRLRSRARRFRAVRSSTPRTRDTPGRAFRLTGITVRSRRRPREPRRRLRWWGRPDNTQGARPLASGRSDHHDNPSGLLALFDPQKPTPFTRQSTTLHGGSRRPSRAASHASGRSGAALPVDDRGEDRDVRSLARGSLNPPDGSLSP
jgi:hypothetical protein